MLSLCCWAGFALVVASGGQLLAMMCWLLLVAAAPVVDTRPGVCKPHQLHHMASVAEAHGHSCSLACGIFPDQRWNLGLLHWQADSLPLSQEESPSLKLFQ